MADQYAVPSSRFARTTGADPSGAPNMYAAPRPYNPVDDGSVGMTSASSGTAYAVPPPAATRPGSTTKTPEQLQAEASARSDASMAGAASSGFQNSSVPATSDVTGNIASVLGNTAAGAASGAAAGSIVGGVGAIPGAVIGGGIALVTSGLNAWVGNRQARAERDRANSITAENRRIAAQDRADLEKWRTANNLNTIAAAKENRRQFNANFARQKMKDTSENMQNILATSASAKAQWAKFGFV